jgi:protein TonB
MKLTDIQEDIPALPPPPPPRPQPVSRQNTVEAIAENMLATDETPADQVVGETAPVVYESAPAEDFLPQHKISVIPQFSDDQIRKNIIYPPIALRSGLEGTVILELFIDSRGEIKRISVLKEEPSGRGFSEAAINAFKGVHAVPAQANGAAVAVRYRYPVRFKISG